MVLISSIPSSIETQKARQSPCPPRCFRECLEGKRLAAFPSSKQTSKIQPPASERNRMDKTPLNDDLMRKILHDHIRQMVEYKAIQRHKKLWRDYSPTERLQRMLEEAISMIAEEIMKGRKENGE